MKNFVQQMDTNRKNQLIFLHFCPFVDQLFFSVLSVAFVVKSSDPVDSDKPFSYDSLIMNRWTLLLCLLVTLALTTAAMACPMCKDSVPSSDSQTAGGLPGGFNDSVYFMLGGFLLVLGLISTIVIKGVRASNAYSRARGFPTVTNHS